MLGLSAAWACVNLICGTIASLPIMVYRTDARGGRTVAREHPLYRLLHDSPNFDQTAVDFWEFMTAAVELWGNAYAEVFREGARSCALSPIRPDIVTVARNKRPAISSTAGARTAKTYERTQRLDPAHPRLWRQSARRPEHAVLWQAYVRARRGDRARGRRDVPQRLAAGRDDDVREVPDRRAARASSRPNSAEKFAGAMNTGPPDGAGGRHQMGEPARSIPEDAQMLRVEGLFGRGDLPVLRRAAAHDRPYRRSRRVLGHRPRADDAGVPEIHAQAAPQADRAGARKAAAERR